MAQTQALNASIFSELHYFRFVLSFVVVVIFQSLVFCIKTDFLKVARSAAQQQKRLFMRTICPTILCHYPFSHSLTSLYTSYDRIYVHRYTVQILYIYCIRTYAIDVYALHVHLAFIVSANWQHINIT